MNRFDRILGILLLLRSGKALSAPGVAERFGVSTRTIYRDMETLSILGVPVYAERGREGGFRLLEGYFLPPLMFSTEEAISLLLGLTLLDSLQAVPFAAQMETAQEKLLAAVPDQLRTILSEAQKIIGFEKPPRDAFHIERFSAAHEAGSTRADGTHESQIVSMFLQAILERRNVRFKYRSPYARERKERSAEPAGLFWDNDFWYLVTRSDKQSSRLWRADRMSDIRLDGSTTLNGSKFDVRELLDRNWLGAAMQDWIEQAPVRIRLSCEQAHRLQSDWYYRHARFEPTDDDRVLMTFGQDMQEIVFELLRWLGPGAELIEPREWRVAFREELELMIMPYDK